MGLGPKRPELRVSDEKGPSLRIWIVRAVWCCMVLGLGFLRLTAKMSAHNMRDN